MLYMADIIIRDNVFFPDNGEIDIKAHPTINISHEVNNKIFFLGVTSETSKYAEKLKNNEKHVIKPIKGTPIIRPSVVKLDHILVEDYRFLEPLGSIDEITYDKIIDKLHKVYDKHKGKCDGIKCGCSEYRKEINF